MIFEPKLFYRSYLEDYHKFKVILYQKVLAELPQYEKELFEDQLTDEEKERFRRTIKSDLRQTYFHAIESFFELLFALNPTDKKDFQDETALFTLTNSNWKQNYEQIVKIGSEETALDFLDKEVTYKGYTISTGHYIFYFGLFDRQKVGEEVFERIHESLDAIKLGLRIIAKDFSDREEYNSYKHGLRIIPAVNQLSFFAIENPEVNMNFDMEDSMSFYCKTKSADELKVKTKLFDTNRDIGMAYFCSNLISNIVRSRKAAFYKDNPNARTEIALGMFGEKEIEECSKINVQIQDLVYSVKRKS